MIVPSIQSLIYGFYQWDGIGAKTFIGLKNYIRLFKDDIYLLAIKNTFYLLLSSVIVIIPIAYMIALALNKKFKGSSFFKTAAFMPTILSTTVIGIIWMFIFNPQYGLLNSFLKAVGMENMIIGWLSDPKITIFSILVVNCWQYVGFIMVILLAGLQNISNELYEAAEIDGANRFRKTISITTPLMKDTILVSLILAITGSLKGFDLVYVMTRGGPFHSTELLATYMYNVAFQQYEYGYGSAISNTIFILGLVFVVLLQKTLQRNSNS